MRGYNVPPWPPGYGWRRESGSSVPPSQMRVSDAERHAVADKLSSHFADGRLDQAEFDERISKTMAAKTRGDLAGLLDDLPPLQNEAPAVASRRPRRSRSLVLVAAIVLFFMATTSWMWNTFAWHAGVWHPHFGFLFLAVVALLMLRRSRWHHHMHRVGQDPTRPR